MFRLNSYDAQQLLENIKNVYDYDKLIIFMDFDNYLFGIYYEENYSSIQTYLNQIATAIEMSINKLIEFQKILNAKIPTRIISFASFGKENIRSFNPDYKKKTKKAIYCVPEILSFVKLKTNLQDALKGTRQLTLSLLKQIINRFLKDQVFIITDNIESDLIPYLILEKFYNERYLYVLFSADKDFVQILDKPNIWQARIVYKKQEYFNFNTKNFNLIRKNTIDKEIKPFKNKYLNILQLALKGDNADNIKPLLKYYGLKKNTMIEVLQQYEDKVNAFDDFNIIKINDKINKDLMQPITAESIKYNSGNPLHNNLLLVSFELQKKFALDLNTYSKLIQELKLIDYYEDDKDAIIDLVNSILGKNISIIQ